MCGRYRDGVGGRDGSFCAADHILRFASRAGFECVEHDQQSAKLRYGVYVGGIIDAATTGVYSESFILLNPAGNLQADKAKIVLGIPDSLDWCTAVCSDRTTQYRTIVRLGSAVGNRSKA